MSGTKKSGAFASALYAFGAREEPRTGNEDKPCRGS